MNTQYYDLKTEHNSLTFTTPFFKAEKMSVLHSGIYNKEFSSMLLSGAVCLFIYMMTEFMTHKLAVLRYILLLGILLITFIGGTKFIFKEKYLEAVFNKSDNSVTIKVPGMIFTHKTEKISFKNIASVELGTKVFAPQNIDGINFVQKISIQHGSAVPGLGEEEEFITVSLKLTDNSERILFAGRTDAEPEIPLKEIKSFLEHTA